MFLKWIMLFAFVVLVSATYEVEVLKSMTRSFGVMVRNCQQELMFGDDVINDFLTYWNKHKLENVGTGCAVMCFSKKLGFFGMGNGFRKENVNSFVRKNGGGEEMSSKLSELYGRCTRVANAKNNTDECQKGLVLARCFRYGVFELKWAPPSDDPDGLGKKAAQQDGSQPGNLRGGHPGQPGRGYPGQAGSGYPGQSGGRYPGQPGGRYLGQSVSGNPEFVRSGFPGQQGGFPGHAKGGYPAQSGGGYAAQAGGSYPGQPGDGFPGQSGDGYPGRPGGGISGQAGGGYPGMPEDGFPGKAGGGYPGQIGSGYPGQLGDGFPDQSMGSYPGHAGGGGYSG